MITETTASKASYASSGGVTLLGALTLQEWAVVIGMFLAVATFAVNWYYQRRRDAREAQLAHEAHEAHEAEMAALEAGDLPPMREMRQGPRGYRI